MLLSYYCVMEVSILWKRLNLSSCNAAKGTIKEKEIIFCNSTSDEYDIYSKIPY